MSSRFFSGVAAPAYLKDKIRGFLKISLYGLTKWQIFGLSTPIFAQES
jgi:hypothetical protein